MHIEDMTAQWGKALLSLRMHILGWMLVLVPNCKCNPEEILTPLLLFLGIMQKQEAAVWECRLVRRDDGLGSRGGVGMWPGRGDLRTGEVGTAMGSLGGDDKLGRSWGRA